jgi:hypothetical protein
MTKSTADIRKELTDLMVLFNTINNTANDIAAEAALIRPLDPRRQEVMDRYYILLDALNIVQNQLADIKQAAIVDTPSNVDYIRDLLAQYGVAERRQLNAPLDPEEPIQWADDRPWIAEQVVAQIQAAMAKEVR